jgi:hypothetical protein
MAVLLIASAPDKAKADCQEKRQQQRAAGRQHHGQHHLEQAEPEHMAPHGAQLRQAEFEPDDEHQEDHAELAQMAHALRVLRQRQRMRPDDHAGHQVAEHRRQLHRAKRHHTTDCSQQKQQRELEGRHARSYSTPCHRLAGPVRCGARA